MTLIGQNGCGKSTLLKIIPRAVTPQSGYCTLDGKPIGAYPSKILARRIAYLAQVHTSPPDIDVRTLVSYGRYPYRKAGRGLTKTDGEIVAGVIRMTGLEPLSEQPLSTLSGGERQRAWIAMTVAQEPEILILDEPTTGLHTADVAKLIGILQRLCDAGNTVLVIEHNLDVIKTADYIIDLGPEGGDMGGSLVACGTPEEVAQSKYSFTGAYIQKKLEKN